MASIRERLRELPGFPADMPELEAAHASNDPGDLFLCWLENAIASGMRQPHAMTLSTVRPDGTPEPRTLILKDVDESGYHFSTHRTSRKGVQLAENPRASMLFFWRESGREVRILGNVNKLSDDISQADWSARPSYDGKPNPDWQVYALRPEEYEFLQARQDRNHTRLGYQRTATGWTGGPVTTPGG